MVLCLSVDFYIITGIIWFDFIVPNAPSHDLCVMSVPLTVAVKSLLHMFKATETCTVYKVHEFPQNMPNSAGIHIPLHHLKKAGVTVMLQTYIWEVPGLNLSWATRHAAKQVGSSGNTVDLLSEGVQLKCRLEHGIMTEVCYGFLQSL
jgi:hypothetical protein